MPEVNYLAVVVAAVAAFILGALWYSPVAFSPAWVAENRFDIEAMKKNMTPAMMARSYVLAVVAALIAAYALDALLIGPPHHGDIVSGAKRGFAAGFCWVGLSFASNYAFEQRSTKLWCINAGYYIVQFTMMGTVLAAMQ